ncbi:MAG TPA: lipolytic enzyme, partial [Verrucomicrobiae bacterium]
FTEAFNRVDGAVMAKQSFETLQIKTLFYTHMAKLKPDYIAQVSDDSRAALVDAVAEAFQPLTHTLVIQAR